MHTNNSHWVPWPFRKEQTKGHKLGEGVPGLMEGGAGSVLYAL